MTGYYVYYRVAEGVELAARDCVRQLLERIAAATGTTGRLMVKRGEPGLWMEVYELDRPDAEFERALRTAVDALEFHRVLAPGWERKLECFECV